MQGVQEKLKLFILNQLSIQADQLRPPGLTLGSPALNKSRIKYFPVLNNRTCNTTKDKRL